MSADKAEAIWIGAGAYLVIGAVVAIYAALRGAAASDAAARGAGLFFRLLIMPGVALLWPIMILRYLSGQRINAPIEGREEAS
jgi:hypothetical protein